MKKLVCLLLVASLFITACTPQQLQIAQLIVTGAEGLLPVIAELFAANNPQEAATAQTISNDTDAALQIADDFLENPTAAGEAQAAADFQALLLPGLIANLNPQQQKAWTDFVAGIQKFIGLAATTTTTLQAAKIAPKDFKLSAKNTAQIQQMRGEIKAVRSQLHVTKGK